MSIAQLRHQLEVDPVLNDFVNGSSLKTDETIDSAPFEQNVDL